MAILRISTLTLAIASIAICGQQALAQDKTAADQEEINQSYELNAGANVTIRSINGPVSIETWNQPRAEIRIFKTSRFGAEELKRVKVIIDHTPNSLDLYTEKLEERDGPKVNVRVEARLPRQIALQVKGINGATGIGAIDGQVEIDGINGRFSLKKAADLEIDGINGATEIGAVEGNLEIDGINGRVTIESAKEVKISGVNGSIQATLSTLANRGIQIEGVNGSIRLGLPEGANANIDVTKLEGGTVKSDFALSMTGQQAEKEFHAQLGSGGAPIRIHGINGSIHLLKSSPR